MLEFVSSIINHRVNLGELLKIFQVAKNHNEALTGSSVHRVIRDLQGLEPELGSPPGAQGPGTKGISLGLNTSKGLQTEAFGIY